MQILSLTSDSVVHHDWKLTAISDLPSEWAELSGRHLDATVPGEVHTDLLAAGVIPDPFDGDNEAALQWVGRTNWRYALTFDWAPGDEPRHDLVAEGLDTFATITLNGTEVGRTANQHRRHRFDVTSLLRPGSNELVIDFAAPVPAAEQASEELGPRPAAYPHPYNAVRKMASSYGWDWGPDLAGAGIWKPIRIESWDTVRLDAVRPLATLDNGIGVVQLEVDLEWLPDADDQNVLEIEIADRIISRPISPDATTATLDFELAEVEPWWPRGYGDQPLYPVRVLLRESEDDHAPVRDRWDGRIGFRTVDLSVTPDRAGSGFSIKVNGQPIYIKGYNWIPDDAFLTRLDADRYRESIMEAYAGGANLLRIWGGGIYESDYFYTVCDELGILVWQDFPFACAAYSEDEPLWSEVEAEARQAISRLSKHPSLAVWNGNNENLWGYVEWGWRPELDQRSWGDGYYQHLLPKLVEELDPRTPYSAGSPYSYAEYHHPNDPRHGTMHIWDVWNREDYSVYRSHRPRFVSEFGFQGPPAWSTLTSVVHDQPLDPYGPQMLVHQKAADGNLKLERGLGDHLPMWRTMPKIAIDDWHWLTQLNQARALRFGIEHFRSLAPHNTGVIVWQLNDNWPVISWAAVDYAGIRKPLWYAIRDAFADRLLTVQPAEDDHDQLVVIAHNDTALPWAGELVITRRSVGDGTPVLAKQAIEAMVEPRQALTILLDESVRTSDNPTEEFLEVRLGEAMPAYGYFVEDPQLQLAGPSEAYGTSVSPVEGGYHVRVEASALVKDLALFPDRLDPAARVDSGLITLRAGQSHTFVVSAGDVDQGRLSESPVLRSVNDVVTG